jgi:hypothetical protein
LPGYQCHGARRGKGSKASLVVLPDAERQHVLPGASRAGRKPSAPLNCSPELCRLIVQVGLLEGIDGVPDEAFEFLDLGFPLRNRSVKACPLPDQRPCRSIFVQQPDQVIAVRVSSFLGPFAFHRFCFRQWRRWFGSAKPSGQFDGFIEWKMKLSSAVDIGSW